jgi:hypothetical protein
VQWVQASRAVAAMMRTLLPALGHSPAEDCQVLTPGHKGPLGVSRAFPSWDGSAHTGWDLPMPRLCLPRNNGVETPGAGPAAQRDAAAHPQPGRLAPRPGRCDMTEAVITVD